MTLKRILGGFAAGMMVAGLTGAAFAAEALDLVGTWKPTGEGHASVRLGAATKYRPEDATPNFGTPKDAWTFVIREQRGRAFHGVARPPGGGEDDEIVGVISLDGDHLIMQAKRTWFTGEVHGDKIEFCFQSKREDLARVACYLTAKE